MIWRLLEAHEMILVDAHEAAGKPPDRAMTAPTT